jgi:HPt (histidine-containing phosphotransfer) domain-containing protein
MNSNENESAAAAGEPAVDFDQLRAASGEDPAFLADLVKLYFEQAGQIMPALGAAVAKRSAREVDYLSHKLAGASLSCGMSAMVAPLKEMERRGRGGDLTGAEGYLAQATASLEIVRAAVQEYLRASPPA